MRMRSPMPPLKVAAIQRKTMRACCLIAFLAVSANMVAQAQGIADINSVAQCSRMAEPAARLACYDRLHAPTQTPDSEGPQSRSWPEFNSVPRALPAVRAQPNTPALPKNSKLASGVTSFSISRSHKFIVTLDNGQIWRQLESDDGIAQFRDHGPNRIVISHGFWKSYDLKLNDMSAVFKVQRVK